MRREEFPGTVELAARETLHYLAGLDERNARSARADEALEAFGGALPERGHGALETLEALARDGLDSAVHSAGPRFFHFVTGGVTPAALGADWLASAVDQMAGLWVSSPLAARLESVSLAWLRELFGLPAEWGVITTTGATMANFVGLAAARRWWAHRHGVDVDADGLAGLPAAPVLSSGYLHASSYKALAMLGLGRRHVRLFCRDGVGRLDEQALAAALRELEGAPAILIANAGEVNAGDFDPIARMADLAEEHGAWLHVDGAFGLFARVSPHSAHLAAGCERADSVTVDGHKWLNVPYDCGFAFLRDLSTLGGTFALDAAYLPSPDEPRPNFAFLGPESSRRARSLAVWATLRAYGRAGYREMVERHLELARRVGRRIDAADDLERLAEVQLNVVCFRYRPPGLADSELDELNARLGEEVLADGRVFVGTTRYDGRVAFRPTIVNWRTTEEDADLLVDVVRELGAALLAGTK